MKRIAVDMDGVLANVYSQFIDMHAAEFGEKIPWSEMDGKPEAAVFPNILSYVNSPGFFLHAPLMDDCQAVLQEMNEKYKIYIVSAATEFPNSLTEKQSWLNIHFPFITWQQMVFCGSKEIISAEIMIDDHFKNLNFFNGETFLFTQPHNKLSDPGKHKRIETWKEIAQIFLS